MRFVIYKEYDGTADEFLTLRLICLLLARETRTVCSLAQHEIYYPPLSYCRNWHGLHSFASIPNHAQLTSRIASLSRPCSWRYYHDDDV
jgi:hypothetical protein